MARVIKPHDSLYSNYIAVNKDDLDTDVSDHTNDEMNLESIKIDEDPVIHEISDLKKSNTGLINKIEILEKQLNEERDKSESEYNNSKNEGVKLGIEQGRKEYLISVQDKLDSLDKLINDIAGNYQESLLDSSDDFIDIIFTSVTKIIAKEYSKDTVRTMVSEIIETLSNSNEIILNVSADDIDYFNDYEFLGKSIKISVDSRVQHGGFIVESNNERLDCRLDSKIEIFKELLVDAKSYAG